jgi:hypothetical protein
MERGRQRRRPTNPGRAKKKSIARIESYHYYQIDFVQGFWPNVRYHERYKPNLELSDGKGVTQMVYPS